MRKHGGAIWLAFREVWPALTLPVIIVGGILGGIFTATEAGAVAAVVALLLGLFYYREIQFRDLPRIFLATARTTAIVLFLCGMAMVSAWLLTRARVPFALADLLTSMTDSTLIILLVCNVLLFLIGFVMDLTPAILILAPIIPPVGTVLYVATGVAGIKMEALVRSLIPFLVTLLSVLVLLILFPELVMFIPNMVY